MDNETYWKHKYERLWVRYMIMLVLNITLLLTELAQR